MNIFVVWMWRVQQTIKHNCTLVNMAERLITIMELSRAVLCKQVFRKCNSFFFFPFACLIVLF